jgi:phosphoribosylglycinamide formyltransferase-1
VDDGPIVVQAVVPVHPDDNEDSLAARVLDTEHRCYPIALELVASGRARVINGRVVIAGAVVPDAVLLNPATS